jgi:phage terminase large subunit-like protein
MACEPDAYYFDQEEADRVCTFFPLYLRHVKGRQWSGKPFELAPWQRELLREAFGWKRKADGTRRYRTVYLEVPRKNGKSTLTAGVGLYLLFSDFELGAEIYSAAADRAQAGIVFSLAAMMRSQSPRLSAKSRAVRHSIFVPHTYSTYRVLSSDVPTKHGLNAHGILFDEVHAQPNRELWDVLTSSTGSRQQPMTWAITTAGVGHETLCWNLHEQARRSLDPKAGYEDDRLLARIYAAPEDADWQAPETWRGANPNLGISVSEDFLRGECARAKADPSFENTFRRLYLNQWTSQEVRWIPMTRWDACGEPFDWRTLRGRVCYGGLDLSSTTDLTAFALAFPPEHAGDPVYLLVWYWVPAERIDRRVRADRVPYDRWIKNGFVQPTPGDVVSHGHILRTIGALGEVFDIEEIAFDRWGSAMLVEALEAEGFTMVQHGQGFKDMSPAAKEFYAAVLSGRLRHGGNPPLRWNADNVAIDTDPTEAIKPTKAKSRERIDGIVASIMAVYRAAVNSEEGTFIDPSVRALLRPAS